MKIHQHLLTDIPYLPSPNYNERPKGVAIDLIVIHNISLPPGEFGRGYISAFFRNQLPIDAHPAFQEIADMKVSSHLVIYRAGNIEQFVPFHLRAWHAGVSTFQGRSNCNDFSIGIELEGSDTTTFTDEQYTSLFNVIRLLRKEYSIPMMNIVGHSDIAPDRKTDPGPCFDWALLRRNVNDVVR
jgi:AmpD protein